MDRIMRYPVRALHVLLLLGLFCPAGVIGADDRGDPVSSGKRGGNEVTIPITLGGKTIQAVLADEDKSRGRGLLGWENITDEQGMLLDFLREGNYAIHMETMKFAIDAIWIDGTGTIRLIYPEIMPNTGLTYPAMFPCRYCLEVKAGFCKKYGVKIGQQVKFGEPGSDKGQ
jgi:uncharacterized membrane protein (UPF0127 family)